ncbi:MAG: hypothetical protein J6C26_07425 [Clostridia bacterium]|nr:hypothetical protein [Clostridia bacterium]
MKTLLSRKSILSILMVLAILSSGVFSFYAIDSYSLYMSQERPLTKTSPTSYNSDWLEEPFVMREGLLDDYQSFYEDAQISVGNVYQERLVNGELELVCLATGNFENYNHSGNDMYLSVGGTISHLDLTTLEMSVIYTSDTAVSDLRVFDDIIFFQIADSIYHYYSPTETLRLLTTVEDIRAWKPMSNYVIRIVEDNPLYYEAVVASGVSESEKPTDIAAFSAWLNQNLSLETSPESKVLQQCDVQNILSASGVSSVIGYWYNVVTDQVLSEYTEIEQPVQAQTFQLTRSSTATARSSATARSVTPITWMYPSGTYFSDHKTTGCTCHSNNCSWSDSSVCDCLIFNGAIQCNGYARYIFYLTSSYLVSNSSATLNYTTLPITPDSEDSEIRTYFENKNLPIFFGTTVTMQDEHGNYIEVEHYILIYAVSANSIGICEANTGRGLPENSTVNKKCRILNNQVLTYQAFKTRYTSFTGAVVPSQMHTHTVYYDIDGDAHIPMCSTCGVVMGPRELHDYDIDGYCFCGSILPRSINELVIQ